MKRTALIDIDFISDLKTYFENECASIQPAFPNWQKSFVSGPESPLYSSVEHRIPNASLEESLLLTQVRFLPRAEGPPGHVHGGVTAGLIDEVMGVLIWHHQVPCVTQNLNLHYLKPLPVKQTAYVITQITRTNKKSDKKGDEKNVLVATNVFSEDKTLYVSAQGTFHRLTKKQLDRFILQMRLK